MKKVFTLLSAALCAVGAWAQNSHNGHEYVDLGLPSGTMWATCNVGADAPEAAGSYFAWGEITTKGNYDWGTYKWCNGSSKTLIKYCTTGSFGSVDNKSMLEEDDDVAVQKWGGSWSMPTIKQQKELCNECYLVWTTSYKGTDIRGLIVYKAKKADDKGIHIYDERTPDPSYDVASDTHIFLPSNGVYDENNIEAQGTGYYWSRSLGGTSDVASVLSFNLYGINCSSSSRGHGLSVRPVFSTPISQITIGETTKEYFDTDEFKTAIESVVGPATIKLLRDVNLTDEDKKLDFNIDNTNITLDLNGHTLKSEISMRKNTHLTICDNSEQMSGKIESDWKILCLYDNSSLTINGGSFAGQFGLILDDMSSVMLNGGSFDETNAPVNFNSEDVTVSVAEGKVMKTTDGTVLTKITGDVSLPGSVVAISDLSPIAQIFIGETATNCYDAAGLKTAIQAVEGSASVKLLNEVKASNYLLINPVVTSDITIDLNGYKIINCSFKPYGKLTVEDSSEDNSGTMIATNAIVYNFEVPEGAELTINGGTFQGSYYAVYGQGGKIIINDGYFKKGTYSAINSSVSSMLFLNGGTFEATSKGSIFVRDLSTVTIGEGKALKLADGTILTEVTSDVKTACEVVEKSLTPTAIDAVNAEMSGKVVKTIENGKVVIIRNGEKYDLAGRKL